ncbi:unnamed protein product, partial [Effrenium voratum]
DGKGWSGGSTRPDGEANQPANIKEKRPKVFLEVELHKRQLGRIVLELFGDVVPKTVENFRCLCTGEKGISAVSGKPLSFKGSRFHKIIPGKIIQGGDITKGDGSGGDSIYNQDGDGTFGCENFKVKHDRPALVSMAHKRGQEGKNCSQFFFTSKAEPKLDGKHTVFGRVIEGLDKLSKLESMGTKGGTPLFEAVISDCGELESACMGARKRKMEQVPLPPGWKQKESRSKVKPGREKPEVFAVATQLKGRGGPGMASLKEPLLPNRNVVPKGASAVQTALAFAVFIAVRSFHPIIIDISKTDGKLPYGKATPCVVNSAVDIAIGNTLALLFGGMDGLKQCWDPVPLKIFSAIAVVYAFGDFLEMQSMAVMGGAAYQILLQSKLLVTALIMWGLRGQRQTTLQWNVLVTIALGMSAFVLSEDSSDEGSFQPIGLLFVVAKVFFSCLCAVLAEKHLKAFKEMPIYAQVAQLKIAWLVTSLLLTLLFDRNVREDGFWSGWDSRTIVVAISWVCKGWSTFYVLKTLDSVLKNIGEAAAILVIYIFDVLVADAVSDILPVHGKDFHIATCLMVLVIVLTVISYTLAPTWKSA